MAPETPLPDVLHLLAHRYPFLLIDRITAVDPGLSAEGIKRVTGDEWFMQGDPSKTMPGTLIIEALAQLSGAVMLGLAGISAGAVGYFVALNRVRFRSYARAGDELRLEVRLLQFRRGICRTAGTAWVHDQRVARAELTTIVRAGA